MAENLAKSVRELAGSSLRETDTSGVFFLDSLEEVRELALLRLFADTFDQCAIWLAPEDVDILDGIDTTPNYGRQPNTAVWQIMPSSTVMKLVPDLYRGAWGLFFADAGRLSGVGPSELTFEPTRATVITVHIGASIGVISWYDDTEWLVCLPEIAEKSTSPAER